ncbi:MAG: acyl-CoA dehydratase activase [Bacillota bacterium]|jgi:predicted CoA-substrate-specific enzyme activase
MDVYMGIDVGSVSTNLVLLDERFGLLAEVYLRTKGRPIQAVQEGLAQIKGMAPSGCRVKAVGTTGSGRQLAGALVGADTVKNEITAHAVAALHFLPDVRTIIEIGGQDSKMIIVRDGVVIDFGMNTMCAAGTGSFLDQQANRLGIAIEDFGSIALRSTQPVRIAGRCTVFAESDMVHKQQIGCKVEDILYGLCQAMVRNYLNNVGNGKRIEEPVVFQGGVALNAGIRRAFEEHLGTKVHVPPHHTVMGAIGAAILASEAIGDKKSSFAGFEVAASNFETTGFDCQGCDNACEIVELRRDGSVIARWGGRCGKWETVLTAAS